MSDAVLKGAAFAGPARRGPIALAGAVIAMGLVVGALILLTALPAPAPPPLPVPARPTWLEIQKPVRIFDLEAPALSSRPPTYSARRLSSGVEREDILTFGAFDATLADAAPADSAPAMRLRLQRRGGPAAPTPLFAALVREAADLGLSIERAGLPDVMPTRFGRFEIADVVLAAPNPATDRPAKTMTKACSGFRLALDAPALTMRGLACGTPERPIAHADLACLIDRLDLSSAGEDHDLITFFAATELARNSSCAGMRLGPDQVHAAWLDDKPATSRKSLRRR